LQWNGAVPTGQGAQDPTKRQGGFSHRLFHGLTPSTETSCFYFWSAAHSHRPDDPRATAELVDEISKALEQDKWIVQLQQERLSETGDDWLVDIRSDVPRIAMRRALARMLESSGPVAAGPV
jgi:vanillate O-demethylase monooxygenase subunit